MRKKTGVTKQWPRLVVHSMRSRKRVKPPARARGRRIVRRSLSMQSRRRKLTFLNPSPSSKRGGLKETQKFRLKPSRLPRSPRTEDQLRRDRPQFRCAQLPAFYVLSFVKTTPVKIYTRGLFARDQSRDTSHADMPKARYACNRLVQPTPSKFQTERTLTPFTRHAAQGTLHAAHFAATRKK